MNLLKNVILTRASRRADKTIAITFTTCIEQDSEEFMHIDKLLSSNGVLYYSEKDSLTQEEIDAINGVDIKKEGKSKSQRLRNVLYLVHKQLGTKQDFKDYYSDELEKIINHYKKKLNEV